MLGLIQKKINATTPGKLPNGKIKYKHLVVFREDHWVIPFNVLDLIEEMSSASSKQKAYYALLIVLDQLITYTESPEGLKKFMIPKGDEVNWSQRRQEDQARKKV